MYHTVITYGKFKKQTPKKERPKENTHKKVSLMCMRVPFLLGCMIVDFLKSIVKYKEASNGFKV